MKVLDLEHIRLSHLKNNNAYKNMRPPPFNTQDQKWSPDKNAIKNNIPGPGAYSIAGDLNKGKVVAINPDKGRVSI